ncbi:MAG: hypothetical protein JXO44_08050 [Clostridia bacterium]|nr:hypothetical protein [Clostridia bacterium]
MNKERFKSVLLIGLIVLSVVLTKNLLDSKTPEIAVNPDVAVSTVSSSLNIERIIYPQDFIIGFGGGSYTGVYSEETRNTIWSLTTELLPAYLSQLDLTVIDEEEFRAIEKTRSLQMRLPFAISLNNFGEVYGVERGFHEILDSPIDKIVISSSQPNRVYLANFEDGQYCYLKGYEAEQRIATQISKVSEAMTTEFRRVDSLVNFRVLQEDGDQTFFNEEIIPITGVEPIPFVKVAKEIDALAERQDSEIQTLLIKAFGNSSDFIKRLEEIDGSKTYIYGYGDKALRLGISGEISYQEKLSSSVETSSVSFKEGLDIALGFIDGYGTSPQSLYLTDYQVTKDGVYEVKSYYFDYRMRDLSIFTKNMTGGHGIEVVMKNDVVTKFKKNIRRYVKSIDASEIWADGPMFIEAIINKNFDVISENFVKDKAIDINDTETNWQMSTYVLGIMQSLKNVELTYYLDSTLDDERLIPAWSLEIADTLYYFHLYTGDILMMEKIGVPEEVALSRK